MARHFLRAGKSGAEAAGVQALIELRLKVECDVQHLGYGWAIFFDAPEDVNLDFLRPHVLPPDPT